MPLTRLLIAAALVFCAGQASAQPAQSPAPPIIDVVVPPPAPPPGPAPYRPIAPAGSILATLEASGQFTTFLKAASASNLITILKLQPNITVLAPTDAAFAALPPELTAWLMAPANQAQLMKLTMHHLINARVDSSLIRGQPPTAVPSIAGAALTLNGAGPVLKVNDASFMQTDVNAANGVVHVIDRVLMPPQITAVLARRPGPG